MIANGREIEFVKFYSDLLHRIPFIILFWSALIEHDTEHFDEKADCRTHCAATKSSEQFTSFIDFLHLVHTAHGLIIGM